MLLLLLLLWLLIWHWFTAVRGRFTGLVNGDGGRRCYRRHLVGLFLRIVVTVVSGD